MRNKLFCTLLLFVIFLPTVVWAADLNTVAKQECAYRLDGKSDNWRSLKCVQFLLRATQAVLSDKYKAALTWPAFYIDFLSEEESRGIRKYVGPGLLGWVDENLKVRILTPTPYFHQPIEMTLAHEFSHVFQNANKLPAMNSFASEIEARDTSIEVYTLLFPAQ